MPSRTLEDKVEELGKVSSALTEQVGTLLHAVQGLTVARSETAKELAELKTHVAVLAKEIDELKRLKEQVGALADLKINVAVLERMVDDLKKAKEEWARRFWTLLG